MLVLVVVPVALSLALPVPSTPPSASPVNASARDVRLHSKADIKPYLARLDDDIRILRAEKTVLQYRRSKSLFLKVKGRVLCIVFLFSLAMIAIVAILLQQQTSASV